MDVWHSIALGISFAMPHGAAKVDKLTIHWPSGQTQILENPSVDRILTVEEP